MGGRWIPRSGAKKVDHRAAWALLGDRPAQVSVGVGPRDDVEPEPIPAGFEVIRRRWVVERTFASGSLATEG